MMKKPKGTLKIQWRALAYIVLFLAFFIALNINDSLIELEYEYLERQEWDRLSDLLRPTSLYIQGFAVLFIIIATVDFLLTKAKIKYMPLILPALLLMSLSFLSVLDILLTGWTIPGECGTGFSHGNCLMLEGLGEIMYYLLIPTFYIIATILLIINLKLRKKWIATLNDDPGIL